MPMRVIKPSESWRLIIDALWFWGAPALGYLVGMQLLATDGISSLPLWAAGTSVAMLVGMYVVVGVGAGWLKMWQFFPSITPTVAGVVPQVGFLYGGIVLGALAFSLRFVAGVGSGDSPLPQQLEKSELLKSAGMMAALGAVTVGLAGCLYDFPLLELELLRVYTKEYFEGRPTIGVLLSYGPGFFGMVGAQAGIAAWLFVQHVGHASTREALEMIPTDPKLLVGFCEALALSLAVVVAPALLVLSGPIAWKLGLASPPDGVSLGMQGIHRVLADDIAAVSNDDSEMDAPTEPAADSNAGSTLKRRRAGAGEGRARTASR